jgi:hypothetical protein
LQAVWVEGNIKLTPAGNGHQQQQPLSQGNNPTVFMALYQQLLNIYWQPCHPIQQSSNVFTPRQALVSPSR